jgi:hypothetical protein
MHGWTLKDGKQALSASIAVAQPAIYLLKYYQSKPELEPFNQITTLTLAFLHIFLYSSTASSNTYFPHLSLE